MYNHGGCLIRTCNTVNIQPDCHRLFSSSCLNSSLVSPDDKFTNKHHYCIYLVWVFIDFPRPCSPIPINPMQYQVHPTRTMRTHRSPATYTPRCTTVCCIRSPLSKPRNSYWLKFFVAFLCSFRASQIKPKPPPSTFLTFLSLYYPVIILPT